MLLVSLIVTVLGYSMHNLFTNTDRIIIIRKLFIINSNRVIKAIAYVITAIIT